MKMDAWTQQLGGMNWEGGIHIHALPCVKPMAGESPLCSTASSAWCSGVTWMDGMGVGLGGKSKRQAMYVYV